MLNLVQLQERLKDVPMQALMQYANGGNPQVPPFLALGELNRRKKMQESAAAEKAQEMEGAPSIKDQIEQSAGLLALQGNRQKQAAQQQQGIQAAMPMAAPNTTTSEPAQMAGGGAIDDIVVPRDYQAGGMVNPDMLKKLMMLKAMKQKQGVAGLPTRPDMFRRGDYAGGGIVAFQKGGQTDPVGLAPWELETEEERNRRESILPSFIRKILAGGGDPNFYAKAAEAQKSAAKERPAGLTDLQQSAIEDARDRAMSQILNRAGNAPAAAPAAPAAPGGIANLAKAKAPNFEEMFPMPKDFNEQEQLAKRMARKQMYGVSDEYLTDAEKMLTERMGKQEARRAEQPMDQLTEFLSGIAEGRGGTWATQGARGAKASAKLRAAQQEANERQDEANAALKMAIGEKRQALARGDMDAAAAAEKDVLAAQKEVRAARVEAGYKTRDLDIRERQAAAAEKTAGRPSEEQLRQAMFERDEPAFRRYQESMRPGFDTAETQRLKTALEQINNALLIMKKDDPQRKLLESQRQQLITRLNAGVGGTAGTPGDITDLLQKYK